jgi:ATP-dependent DNA helicase UvrD/PcrA
MQSSRNSSPASPLVADTHQQQAIEHVHGPLLVVAGAGTGKTTVLTRRIARLVREGHARPNEILALTYTDNAAQEMRDRVKAELAETDLTGLQASTFHAYCNLLLQRCEKGFGVLDDKDLWIYLRKRIRDLHLNYFVRAANVGQFLEDLLDFMRRCQDELVGPKQYAEYVRRLECDESPIPRVSKSKHTAEITKEEVCERCREISSSFATVEHMLKQENLGTFGHMITRAYQLLRQDADLLANEQQHARFILIDEFQDANFAQVKILELLAGQDRNVFAVGDPDQAIYRFRGASSAAFGLFQRHFPGGQLLVLENNRRSTAPILKCAFAVIDKNPPTFATGSREQLKYRRTPLQSARDEESTRAGAEVAQAPVEAVIWRDRELESSDLVNHIRQKQRQLRCSWKDFTVLYRNHINRDELVKELAQRNIPFSIENMDVLDTPEVRDLLACLGAIVFPSDGASVFRVAALPQFALDPEKLRAAMRSAAREATLISVLEKLEDGPAVLQALLEALQEIRQKNAKSRAALDIIIRRFALNRDSPAIQAVLGFVNAWEHKAITKTGEIGELLDYLDYFREARGAIPLTSHDEDAVRLMTAHAAKGLEFNHVYIIRASSPSFPCPYREPLVEFPRELRDPDSVAQDEGKVLNDQEERRLFYVAMTRARDSLTVYAKQGSGKDSTPPGFLRDLLKETSLNPWLRRRQARPLQVDLFAGEELIPLSQSNTAAWLSLEGTPNLSSPLSATAVETYETCPLQFKLEREWRMPREVPAAIQYGAAMHRVLRSYYDAVRYQRPISDPALIELFRTDLAGAAVQDRYQHELYEKQGIEQLRGFLECARRTPPPEVLHTEQPFTIRIGDAVVNGRIDRIDRIEGDGVAVLDYKTGKPRSQEDADESLQLSIYALAAREKWNYRADRLAFYNLEDNSVIVTTRGSLQLEEAKLTVEGVAEKIAAGKFPANPGFHCFLCPYRNLCPATEKSLSIVPARKAVGRGN